MIKKRTLIVTVLITIVTTVIFTTFASSLVGISLGNKVLIDKSDYLELTKVQNEFKKTLELKSFIEENYYKDTSKVNFDTGVLKGLFESLGDPYSVYMDQEEFKRFSEDSTGEYAGVGLIVSPTEDGYVTVVSPIEDTPAEKAGLKPKDKIVQVEKLEVTAKNFDEAVRTMRGVPGTKVTIKVVRPGNDLPLDFTIVREKIKIKAVKSKVLDQNIGYIQITSFDEDVAKQFKENLDALKSKSLSGLIIDLRNNPGGALDQCVEISDMLLEENLIVFTKDRGGQKEEFRSDAAKEIDTKIVVLVNEGSASASEILTGALKDNKAATIIGSQTFGKGIVQSVIELNDQSAVKLTTSEYFTPSGVNIHGKGIKPDLVIVDDEKTKVDEVLEKGIQIITQK